MSTKKGILKGTVKHVGKAMAKRIKKSAPLVSASASNSFQATASANVSGNTINAGAANGNAANNHDNFSSNSALNNNLDNDLNDSFNTDKSRNRVKQVNTRCNVYNVYTGSSGLVLLSPSKIRKRDEEVQQASKSASSVDLKRYNVEQTIKLGSYRTSDINNNSKNESRSKREIKSANDDARAYKATAVRESMRCSSAMKEVRTVTNQRNSYSNEDSSYKEAYSNANGTVDRVLAEDEKRESNISQEMKDNREIVKDVRSQRDSAIAGSKSTAYDNNAFRNYLISNGEYADFEKYKSRNNSKEQINKRFHKVYRNNNAKSRPASGRSLNSTYEKQRDQKRRKDLKSSKSDQYQK